jgi:hypothetical protein
MATSLAVAARFELPEYFRCRMALEGDRRECVVFARAVPSAWEQGVDIDQPAGAAGLLLKFGETADGRSEPFFAAARMAWFPDTPLGRLGMDVGLLDDLRPEESGPADGDFAALAGSHLDRFRLTTRNREAFYQMLAAASRAAPGQLEEWAAAERTGGASDSVVKLFNDTLSQQGRLVTLAGQAREITEVRVGDDDIRQRFGLDRYYVVFLFTPDSQDNPLAFCTRQLPAGLSPGGGPRFNEPVRVTGFFFNTWAYRSRETEAAGRAKWQLAPLIIGGTPIREPPPAAAPRLLGPRGLLAAAALIAAAAWVAWRLRVRQPAPGDPERPAPDFSSLG